MQSLRETIDSVWRKTGVFCAIFCIVSISISVTSLHYAEAIENDGLKICEATDSLSTSCEDSQRSDNDNETVQAIVEIDLSKKYQLTMPTPSLLTIPLPEYKNSYLFAFISELIKPPISST